MPIADDPDTTNPLAARTERSPLSPWGGRSFDRAKPQSQGSPHVTTLSTARHQPRIRRTPGRRRVADTLPAFHACSCGYVTGASGPAADRPNAEPHPKTSRATIDSEGQNGYACRVEALLIVLVVFAFLLIVFFVLAFRFPEDLKMLLKRLKSVRISKDGLTLELVVEAIQEKEKRTPDPAEIRPLVKAIPTGRRVLWVDDCPANNRAEIQALRGLDLIVDTATTNAEALSYAKSNTYDLVVSDIGRSAAEPPNAGLELPAALRAAGVASPLAFYVGAATRPTTDTEEPVFDTPTELLGWISEELDGGGG